MCTSSDDVDDVSVQLIDMYVACRDVRGERTRGENKVQYKRKNESVKRDGNCKIKMVINSTTECNFLSFFDIFHFLIVNFLLQLPPQHKSVSFNELFTLFFVLHLKCSKRERKSVIKLHGIIITFLISCFFV